MGAIIKKVGMNDTHEIVLVHSYAAVCSLVPRVSSEGNTWAGQFGLQGFRTGSIYPNTIRNNYLPYIWITEIASL